AVISIDFPFYRRWHDLCGCYAGSGWSEATKETVRETNGEGGPACEFVRATLRGPSDAYGYLNFANINEDGRVVAPPEQLGDFGYLVNRFIHTAQHARQISLNPRKLFQVQVWNSQGSPQSPQQREELESLFFVAFHHLQRELKHGDAHLAAPRAKLSPSD
ncbi:MAG: exosortase U, partial [Pirellulales bacterium]|nr:exosortase U [Pirellulales bacterium]